MSKFANLVRMNSNTLGDGPTLTVTSIVPGFLDLGDAGVIDGQDYSYAINDYDTLGAVFQTEDGHGLVDTSLGTIVRNVTNSSNGNARISLSGRQQVILTPRAEDLLSMTETRVANTVLAGPTTAPDAVPTFRALVASDIPALPYGTGTVTSFSSGNLSPLFNTNVGTPTTTPSLGFSLVNAAANTYYGNATGGSTTPSFNTAGAITKTDDTNVTLTLGGGFANALLSAASFALGWTGLLSPARGGTGVNNGSSTLTLGGNLTTSGAFASTFTMTGATGVTFPTSGTLATTSQILPIGGSNTQVQYNNAGAFGGISGATSNGTTLTITSGRATTDFSPTTNNGATLGTTSLGYSTAYFGTGGVLNWGNGNYTITHSSNLLTYSGGITSGGIVTSVALTSGTISLANSGFNSIAFSGTSANVIRTANSGSIPITFSAWDVGLAAQKTFVTMSSGNPATLDLSSDVTVNNQKIAGPTVIASGSFSAANDQVFSAAIPQTFSYLVLVFGGLSSNTATRHPRFQVSVNSGASYDTNAANYPGYYVTGVQSGGTASANTTNTEASIAMTLADQVAAATWEGIIEIFNYQGSFPHFRGQILINGVIRQEVSGAYVGSGNAINAMRMIWNNTGNSDAGVYSLTGYA